MFVYLLVINLMGTPWYQNPMLPNAGQSFGWPWFYADAKLADSQWKALERPGGRNAIPHVDTYVPLIPLRPSLIYRFEGWALAKNFLTASLILTYTAFVLKRWKRNRPPQILTVRHAGLLVIILSVLVAPLCSGQARVWWHTVVPYRVEMFLKLAAIMLAIILPVNLLIANSPNMPQQEPTE